jgi:HPt (histidine-containing phosphotransfer) domain-containing protein
MARQQPIELFMPPNMLKAKVGGGLGGIDMAALKRADAALETLSGEFSGWLTQDVKALVDARAQHAAHPGPESRAALLRAAHDIKGQAATFNFPLVARVAGSLSRLLGELPPGRDLPQGLTDAHVQAVQVIHRENIQDIANPMAQMLCAELDAKVTQTLAA